MQLGPDPSGDPALDMDHCFQGDFLEWNFSQWKPTQHGDRHTAKTIHRNVLL